MIKKIISHPLFSGSAIMVGGSMAVNVVNLAYHFLMGRALGLESYGALFSIFSIIYIVSIVPFSASLSIVKFVSAAENKKEVNHIYAKVKRLITKISVIAFSVTLILSIFIKDFLHIDSYLTVALFAPTLFFTLMTLTNYSVAQGLKKFTGMVVSNLISSLGKLVFGLILVYVGYSVMGAMAGIALGALFAYVYSEKYIKQYVNDVGRGTFNIGPLLKYSGPTLLQALAFTAYFTFDVVLVKNLFPTTDAGLYASLSTLGKIIFFAVSPVSSVMFPIVASKYAKKQAYGGVFLSAMAITSGAAVVLVIAYYLLPEFLINVLYGKDYIGAAPELFLMGIFMALYSINYFLMNFLLSIGKLKAVWLSLFVAVLQVILIWFRHTTLREVIVNNIYSMVLLLVGLIVFVVYNYQNQKNA
jgi:O-antigen/teichoic acid export membrane protein